jgi:hypothetical protein
MIASMWFAAAFAGECARVPVAEQRLDLAGASGFVIKGVEGAVELVGTDDGAIRASGTACTADVQIKLTRKDGIAYLSVKGARDADLQLQIAVPRAVAAVTAQQQTGPISIADLPTRFAVVSGTGPVAVKGAQSVRLAYTTGAVQVDGIHGDLIVDHLEGGVDARGVGGDVSLADVTGPVHVDDVGGDLAVQGQTGAVSQSNVHGSVRLP